MKWTLLILTLSLSLMAVGQVPQFVIETPSGGWHLYSTASIDDSLITASVTQTGSIWTLELTANSNINAIRFPYESLRQPLDADLTDDIYYYPILGGGTVQAPYHDVDFSWYGAKYPGGIFAPLVVTADEDDARIVAATNWPPLAVTPYYAAERVHMHYDDLDLTEGATIQLACLIETLSADPATGEKPWQLALDIYRAWLDEHVETPTYPQPMIDAHGYIFIGVTDWPEFELTEISDTWAQWRDRLPWMQIWGQMSNYAGPPEYAVPPLEPGEITDCCYAEYDMHPRYVPELVDFMNDSIVGLGFLGGYYSSPYLDIWDTYEALLLDTDEGVEWLSGWLDQNELQYGANAFYVDILGRRYWGDPQTIIELIDGDLIRDRTLIEGLVDIYPVAGLLSGNLIGMAGFPGGPGITPETSNDASFPAMQRYLLNDRMVFMGPSNGDSQFMGPAADYWLERQTFLLGAKYEVSHPNNDWNPNTPNPILTQALDLRDEVNWWQRDPRYMDTNGITGIPSDIEVRRFEDMDGCQLFAIDNWAGSSGQSFTFSGIDYEIPTDQLSIIDDCTVDGLQSNTILHSFEILPNPSSSFALLRTSIPLNKAQIVIIDSRGRVIEHIASVSGTSYQFELGTYSNGVYFVRIHDVDRVFEPKALIIAH